MRRFAKLLTVQLKLYLREPVAAFFTLVFPSALLVLFGNIYGNDPNPLFGGRGTVDVEVPSYIALVIASVGLMSAPIATASMREKGVLRRLRVTPLPPGMYLAADVAANFLMNLAGVALLVVVGRVGWGMRFDGHWASAAAAFTLSAGAFLSLGYLLASVVPTSRVANVVGMVLLYPMIFLSGASIPLEVLPPHVREWARFVPLAYVVRLMRGMWEGQPWSNHWSSVAVLGAMAVVSGAVAARLFRWE